MLHTVNKSAYTHSLLRSCMDTASKGDGILLLNDGVYGGSLHSPCADAINALVDSGYSFYALKADVEQREIVGALLPCIKLIDYAGFVELTALHQHTQSWY